MSTTKVGGPDGLAQLDGDGLIPTSLMPPGGDHPDLAAHDTLGLATQAELNAHATATHAATQAAAEATAAAALSGHAADSTAVHGITDTEALATDAEVATAVSDHAGAANPHPTYLTAAEGDAAYEATGGIATHAAAADPHTGYLKEADFDDIDFLVGSATGHTAAEIVVGTSPGGELGGTWASPTVDATHSGSTHAATQAAAEATAAGALSGHAADTTAIHGIADTSALSLTSHDHDADYEAAGGIATHAADATAVHGIADTTVLATDAEVATAVSDHAAAANPHPTYLTQAEGDALYQPTDGDLTAIAALTTTSFGRGLLALADAAALGGAHTHAGGLGLTVVEVNLGAAPVARRAGRFTIAGTGMTVGKPVLISQASGPYTGKGTRADEAEMDQLTVTGKVTSATVIECFWTSRYRVRGNVKMQYAVSS